jgi:hypothetical protein
MSTTLGSDFTFGDKIYSGYCSVVNRKGEIVALTEDKRTFKIFECSGESRILCEAPNEECASECYVEAMDIDAEDNIHVITAFRKSDDQSWSFKLFIFDENGNKKHESVLPFHQSSRKRAGIAINKDGKIAILNCEEKILYIGNVCVELNSSKVDKSLSLSEFSITIVWMNSSILFSDFNGTKIIAADYYTVYIYTENGQLERKIKIPEERGFIVSVAINHVTNNILVKTCQSSGRSWVSFSEIGELTNSLCLGSSEWIRRAVLTSHPNGLVALVGETGAALLQL